MTPKEKAEELIYKFLNYSFEDSDGVGKFNNAQECARICVNEILAAYPLEPSSDEPNDPHLEAVEFWQQVLKEIDNL